jgi:hypothetical protein
MLSIAACAPADAAGRTGAAASLRARFGLTGVRVPAKLPRPSEPRPAALLATPARPRHQTVSCKEAAMEFRMLQFSIAMGIAIAACGCSGSASTPAETTSVDDSTPASTTTAFLEAVRTGNDQLAASLLTPKARQRTAEKGMVVAPTASESASYQIHETVNNEGGVYVPSDWTDVDADGNMHTQRIVWALRKEAEGWRIAGMAAKLFPDRPPVLLNFEEPDDMLRQEQMAEEEIARRESQGASSKSAAPAKSVQ